MTAAERIYERIVDVQEKQTEIAKEQASAGVVRDLVLSKMTDTLDRLAKATEGMVEIVKAHDAPIRDAAEGIDDLPKIAADNLKAYCHALDVHDKRAAKRSRRLSWLLPLATFAGALLGSQGHEIVAPILSLLHRL